jgi:pyruvate-formate lyase-activating enzyme
MPPKEKKRVPCLLASDGCGHVSEIDRFEATGMRLRASVLPEADEWIPLPKDSVLMELPGRIPVGWDPVHKKFVSVPFYQGKPVTAVSAFAAPAHTQLYTAAYQTKPGAPPLPLFAYTPVGWKEGRFWAAAVRVDEDVRHDPGQFRQESVRNAARRMLKRHPGNRLVRHLVENCVRRYACPNAFNFVLERWECPIPVSPSCSARCLGCISKQPKDGVRSTQDRISFVPTADEIAEMAVPHLKHADRAMVSFGQGCEGEPLTRHVLIERAIRMIRGQTPRGTIHINTNAGHPEALDRLFRAGLDSIRVSMNSARKNFYVRYFKPDAYAFSDVLESMKIARKHNAYLSLNYFVFPGLTDHPDEMEALFDLLDRYKIDCMQARNLNIDPELYIRRLGLKKVQPSRHGVGILEWMRRIRKKAPWVKIGYFNPPKEDWTGSVEG